MSDDAEDNMRHAVGCMGGLAVWAVIAACGLVYLLAKFI
jgi:threonine/homoserine/homoserine lactone efflux protein